MAQLESIGAIEGALAEVIRGRGIDRLTISHLTSEDRVLTVQVAAWLRDLVLPDGNRPLGVIYPSKHGSGDSYAYWMQDDDGNSTHEVIGADEGTEILEGDPGLVAVAERFNLRIH